MKTILRPVGSHGSRGFTLVELIIVVVVGAIMAATLSLFLPPALESYRDTRVRSDLVDQTDTALRRMLRDVRMAVPNSLRMAAANCIEMVPAMTGGRYRADVDATNDTPAGCTTPSATCAAPLYTDRAITAFDSLSTLSATPAAGDWVVVDNQNGNDVYEGTNRAAIVSVATPPASWQGKHRITIASTQFPAGYAGGRFVVVPNNQKAVSYVCTGAGVDASGNGTGTLYRVKNYGFNAAYPSSCQSTATGEVLATHVRSCTFVYDPNQGATQQSGFLWLEMAITRNNETVFLAEGAHVMNVP